MLGFVGPAASEMVRKVAKERFSYPLRPGLARPPGRVWGQTIGNPVLRPSFRGAREREPGISCQSSQDSGFDAEPVIGRAARGPVGIAPE
jgi:hypothetical protein